MTANKLALKKTLNQWVLRTLLLGILILPEIVNAQYFYSSDYGDVNAGFRKTGAHQETYEMVVYLGNITNFLQLPPGTTINITNCSPAQLSVMCPDGFGNLQWSAFSSFSINNSPDGIGMPTALGEFPGNTCWYTFARTNATIRPSPFRNSYTALSFLSNRILNTADTANSISQSLGTTNAQNNTLVVLEPVASENNANGGLSIEIGDRQNSAIGDFYSTINYSVENTTPNNFAAPTVSDFYQNCPITTSDSPYPDPITGQTNGNCYNVGYFTLNPSGTMTFTRASAQTAPSIGLVSSSTTNGFSPLTVVFTNSANGSITSWVWNFGNGISITNTTGASVTNTYAAGGDYTVTLTVSGPGGTATTTLANFIVASPTPVIHVAFNGGNIVFSGADCPAGVTYRILSTTNLISSLSTWTPISTNQFLSNGTFTNTVTAAATGQGFFRLVSP